MSRLSGLVQGYQDRMQLAREERRFTSVNPNASRTELMNQMTLRERAEGAIRDVHSVIGHFGPLQKGELEHARFIIDSARKGW